ncbi:tryptophan synthase subunit alpha [Siphonobacter aquaeclarae]|jgi:tryptophan synthase alpha chain|uniref:Tryptophan synthase alpha chain n=1 Tax=Siphonobacter aquaeclarae TaxID=563176 RepID=A0A1G9VNM8_9BACT|nr:tryptophan synthase subunit alpha [Siphonobacter aquaeclarae]SDM73759.1 tryptophan synthase, alpha chain [Siphonobacter aquaeclarae]
MTNRITHLFSQQSGRLLNVYFTAGFPQLNDTRTILKSLEAAGADLVEIGMPYSDPVADGETIQLSNDKALHNGMTVKTLFEQLEGMREEVSVPVLLMGYINPVIQFGVEAFCRRCREVGVDGLILPDLPADVYEEEFKPLFDQYGLVNIFLITPQTADDRIRHIDSISEGFIYMVSSASTTGAKAGITADQEAYFNRVNAMNLKNPRLIGFGISDNASFERASQYAAGAIIGSAFIKAIADTPDLPGTIDGFVRKVKG